MATQRQSRFDQRASGFDRLFYGFGETVLIEDPDGREWPYDSVIVGDEKVEQRETEIGTELVVTREFTLQASANGRDDDGDPTILNLRGCVKVGSIKYQIEEVETSRSAMAVLKTKRVDFAEVSRQNYRKK